MKSKDVGFTVTTTEDFVRLRVFDGVIPLDAAGQELLEMERARANAYHRELIALQARFDSLVANTGTP